MPKGAHFKKENPRNYQVSFKVNITELEKLRLLALKARQSVPEWLRAHIVMDTTDLSSIKPKEVVKKEKKAAIESASLEAGGQISLF